jgi:hypothetical protein
MELTFTKLNGTATVVSEKVHFHEIAVILQEWKSQSAVIRIALFVPQKSSKTGFRFKRK